MNIYKQKGIFDPEGLVPKYLKLLGIPQKESGSGTNNQISAQSEPCQSDLFKRTSGDNVTTTAG